MADRPILFSEPMVRAILDGRKTQTRRVVKPAWRDRQIVNLAEHGESRHDPARRRSGRFDDPASWGYPCAEDGVDMDLASWPDLCPYGVPGDRLWVRETWDFLPDGPGKAMIRYWAGGDHEERTPPAGYDPLIYGREKKRPSIHMPRWASRITLEVTGVRVERLHEITLGDAAAEGVPAEFTHPDQTRDWYIDLWTAINGAESWDANPWVWVVEFRRAGGQHG